MDKKIKKSEAARQLDAKLHALRSKVRRWLVFDGLVYLFAWTVGLIVVDYAIDRLFAMDRAQRGVMLILILAILIRMAFMRLVKPLRASLSDDALCREVEQKNEALAEELISAFQFSRQDWSAASGISAEMVDATIAEGVKVADAVSFDTALNQKRLKSNRIKVFGLAGVVCVIGILSLTTTNGRIWLNRNLLLGDAEWPLDFHLKVVGVDNGRLVAPRGDNWPVIAEVKDGYRRLPDRLEVQIRTAAGRSIEAMDKLDDGTRFRLLLQNVQEELEFRVAGDRTITPWYKVMLVERPEVEAVDLMATPPAYSEIAAHPLPPGKGPYYVLRGTKLKVAGKANKDLAGAVLIAGDAGYDMPLQNHQAFEVELGPELVVPGIYGVELHDKESVVSPETGEPVPLTSKGGAVFTLRYREDTKPKLKAKAMGISSLVTPGAVIPYQCSAKDDFRVTELNIEYAWQHDDLETGVKTNRADSIIPSGVVDLLDEAEVQFQDRIEVSSFEAPLGSSLSLVFHAMDNDTVSGPKQGSSARIQLRVVSEAELRDDILRREKEARQAFEQVAKSQDRLITDAQAAQVAIRDEGELSANSRAMMNQLQKKQKLLGTSITPIAKRLETISLEVLNNRLETEDSALLKRLRSNILNPMSNLREREVPALAAQFDEVRRMGDQAQRNQAIFAAIQGQDQVARTMERILRFMVKNEEFQQAINLLSEIQKSQKEVLEMTEEEKARRVRDLLKAQGSEGKE